MSNACKRKFKKGETIYVVDSHWTHHGKQAIGTNVTIQSVDNQKQIFVAIVRDTLFHDDVEQIYSFKDYGRLIFDNEECAKKAASELPKPNSVIYQLKGKRIYRKKVIGIYPEYINGVIDLVVRLDRGNDIPIGMIGSSCFLKEEYAIENKK